MIYIIINNDIHYNQQCIKVYIHSILIYMKNFNKYSLYFNSTEPQDMKSLYVLKNAQFIDDLQILSINRKEYVIRKICISYNG